MVLSAERNQSSHSAQVHAGWRTRVHAECKTRLHVWRTRCHVWRTRFLAEWKTRFLAEWKIRFLAEWKIHFLAFLSRRRRGTTDRLDHSHVAGLALFASKAPCLGWCSSTVRTPRRGGCRRLGVCPGGSIATCSQAFQDDLLKWVGVENLGQMRTGGGAGLWETGCPAAPFRSSALRAAVSLDNLEEEGRN